MTERTFTAAELAEWMTEQSKSCAAQHKDRLEAIAGYLAALTAAAERETKLREELDMAARETARLLAVNGESNAVCSCGCELTDHEERGEDGWSCDNNAHECVPTSQAVGQMLTALREENARLKAALIALDVNTANKPLSTLTIDGIIAAAHASYQRLLNENDDAEAEVARLTVERDRARDAHATLCPHHAELRAERQKVTALREYHEVSEAFTMGSEGTYWLGFRDAHTASLAKMDALGLPVPQPPGTTRETP